MNDMKVAPCRRQIAKKPLAEDWSAACCPFGMLGASARWRMVVEITAAVGASFLAGCSGGPFSADDGGGCMACADPTPAAGADDPDCVEPDAGDDAMSAAGAGSD